MYAPDRSFPDYGAYLWASPTARHSPPETAPMSYMPSSASSLENALGGPSNPIYIGGPSEPSESPLQSFSSTGNRLRYTHERQNDSLYTGQPSRAHQSPREPLPSPMDRLRQIYSHRALPRASHPISASAPKPTTPPPKCCVCQDPVTGPHALLRCGHYYDDDCLSSFVQASLNDESLFPAKCCGHTVPKQILHKHIARDVLTAWTEKEAEVGTLKRVYCADVRCGRFLGPLCEDKGSAKMALQCESEGCGTLTCNGCRAKVDYPAEQHICAESKEDEELRKLQQSHGWAQCPGCSRMVERLEGCHHMSCRCGTQFCYGCSNRMGSCTCRRNRGGRPGPAAMQQIMQIAQRARERAQLWEEETDQVTAILASRLGEQGAHLEHRPLAVRNQRVRNVHAPPYPRPVPSQNPRPVPPPGMPENAFSLIPYIPRQEQIYHLQPPPRPPYASQPDAFFPSVPARSPSAGAANSTSLASGNWNVPQAGRPPMPIPPSPFYSQPHPAPTSISQAQPPDISGASDFQNLDVWELPRWTQSSAIAQQPVAPRPSDVSTSAPWQGGLSGMVRPGQTTAVTQSLPQSSSYLRSHQAQSSSRSPFDDFLRHTSSPAPPPLHPPYLSRSYDITQQRQPPVNMNTNTMPYPRQPPSTHSLPSARMPGSFFADVIEPPRPPPARTQTSQQSSEFSFLNPSQDSWTPSPVPSGPNLNTSQGGSASDFNFDFDFADFNLFTSTFASDGFAGQAQSQTSSITAPGSASSSSWGLSAFPEWPTQ